ncbi:MAG: hypothetical protein AAF371_15440 [Pseudomonadota bacterium]
MNTFTALLVPAVLLAIGGYWLWDTKLRVRPPQEHAPHDPAATPDRLALMEAEARGRTDQGL